MLYAALNDLQVFAVDIHNAYLQAPSSQKDYVMCVVQNLGLKTLERGCINSPSIVWGQKCGP